MIGIYITHFVPLGHAHAFGYNEILFDLLRCIRIRTSSNHDIGVTVVYYTDDKAAEDHLVRHLPSGVRLVKNTRPHRPDTQPSMRNRVLDIARGDTIQYAVLLHNDVRVAAGWLDALVHDIEYAEKIHGEDGAIVSPRHIPYHYLPAAEVSCQPFWSDLKAKVRSVGQMHAWCKGHGFSFDGENVLCPPWTAPHRDGHQLMMWIARPEFFDVVGECDERFVGVNHDDQDWGIRALLHKKGSYQSRTCLIGHVEGLTFMRPGLGALADAAKELNKQLFIDKWGLDLFEEMQRGELWPRLHTDPKGVLADLKRAGVADRGFFDLVRSKA